MPPCKSPSRKQKTNTLVSKRLQTELQSLIGYSCYNSNSVLKCGKSAKKLTIMNKMYELYMPSPNPDDDRLSSVELFLEGKGRFRYFFEKKNQTLKQQTTITKAFHNLMHL